MQIFRQTVVLGEAKARDSNVLQRTRGTVLRLRICCKTQIISSFRLCSDLVTALHYLNLLPDLKVIDIVLRNSGTSFSLPYCSYKLHKQSFVNRCLFSDCYWHVLLCGTYILFDLIWFVIIFLQIIGWRLSVSINDMLRYVTVSWWTAAAGRSQRTATGNVRDRGTQQSASLLRPWTHLSPLILWI